MLFIIFFTASAYSQTEERRVISNVLDLRECLRIGLENNFDLQIARNQELVSENNVTFSMAVTKINNTTFEFTTPTPGEPIPEVGSKLYFRTIFGSGLVFRAYITSKTGNLFTISDPFVLYATSFIFDNSSIGFISQYYGVMQKIIERPRVIECEDNMDVITSANIDYEKPFYADELGGRYAVLLELQAPNNEPCVAKLLLINQKL